MMKISYEKPLPHCTHLPHFNIWFNTCLCKTEEARMVIIGVVSWKAMEVQAQVLNDEHENECNRYEPLYTCFFWQVAPVFNRWGRQIML